MEVGTRRLRAWSSHLLFYPLLGRMGRRAITPLLYLTSSQPRESPPRIRPSLPPLLHFSPFSSTPSLFYTISILPRLSPISSLFFFPSPLILPTAFRYSCFVPLTPLIVHCWPLFLLGCLLISSSSASYSLPLIFHLLVSPLTPNNITLIYMKVTSMRTSHDP